MKILVAGTPGTGKTTLSKRLSQELGCEHVDISKLIEEKRAYIIYNKNLDTYEFDVEVVTQTLKQHLINKKNFIIDTHSVEVVRSIAFDYIFVLRVSNSILYKRLLLRKYPKKKIEENIECEIFGVVEEDCLEFFPSENVFAIHSEEDAPSSSTYDEVMHKINTESK